MVRRSPYGIMASTSAFVDFARAVVAEFRAKKISFLAGSIAYSAFVSLVPLLLFLVFALALFGAGWQDQVLSLVTRNVSPVIGRFIRRIFRSQAGEAAGSSAVGTVVLVWGALKLFRGLDTAFEEIYGTETGASLGGQVRDGLVVLVSIVIAVAAIIVATSVFGVFSDSIPFIGLLLPVALALGLVVAFFPMYYVFPGADVTPREVLPGVAVAAFGWALLQGLFQIYVAVSTGGGGTDVVTGVMLLLTWLYFSGVVLLLGAVVNAVLGGHTDHRAGSPLGDATDRG